MGLTRLQQKASQMGARSQSAEPERPHPAATAGGLPVPLRTIPNAGELAGLIGDNFVTDDLIETMTTANNARLANRTTFNMVQSTLGLDKLRREIRDLNHSLYDATLPPAGLPLRPLGVYDPYTNQSTTTAYIAAFEPISKILPEKSKRLANEVIAFQPSYGKLMGIKAVFDKLEIEHRKTRSSLIDATIESLDKHPQSALEILKQRKVELSDEQSGKVTKALEKEPELYQHPESFDLTPADKMHAATKNLFSIEDINIRAKAFLAAGRCDEPLDVESNRNTIDGALSILAMEDKGEYDSPVSGVGFHGRVRADCDCLDAIYNLKDHLTDEQADSLAVLFKRRPELHLFENSFALTPERWMRQATENLRGIKKNFHKARASLHAVKYSEFMDDKSKENITEAALSVIESPSADSLEYNAQSHSLRVLHELKGSLSDAQCTRLMREMLANPKLFQQMDGAGRGETPTRAIIHIVRNRWLPPLAPVDQEAPPRPTITALRSQFGQAMTDTQPGTPDRLYAMREIIKQVPQISPRNELRRIQNELGSRSRGEERSQDAHGL